MNIPAGMRSWLYPAGCTSSDQMQCVEQPTPSPGAGEVLILVHACSLNYRDQAIATGNYFGGILQQACVPLSDGAGEVVAVGAGVSDLAVGERVAGAFFQNWDGGPPNPMVGPALGTAPAPGMLADYVVLPRKGVVRMARSLNYAQAATLPCAGVTAWNALMKGMQPVRRGASVLIIGTGGVSLLALAIAKSAGARVYGTSSSNAKLERLRALGADGLINYREVPEWGAKAAEFAGGGIDHVVEVGGAGTLAQSIRAVGFAGEIALIGVLTRQGDTTPHGLMMKGATLRGIFVGSASMARELNDFIDATGLQPRIDRSFDFSQAKEAFRYQASGELFGKVVIEVVR